jgi:hypothetical protein
LQLQLQPDLHLWHRLHLRHGRLPLLGSGWERIIAEALILG